MKVPILEAVLVADNILFLFRHKYALNTLPPSIGKAGSKLKKPKAILDMPEYNNVVDNQIGIVLGVKTRAMKKRNPKINELKGPIPEMINSLFGVLGSSCILETPPNKYNSISVTVRPYRCAINE